MKVLFKILKLNTLSIFRGFKGGFSSCKMYVQELVPENMQSSIQSHLSINYTKSRRFYNSQLKEFSKACLTKPFLKKYFDRQRRLKRFAGEKKNYNKIYFSISSENSFRIDLTRLKYIL
jgi:hypothetical protein